MCPVTLYMHNTWTHTRGKCLFQTYIMYEKVANKAWQWPVSDQVLGRGQAPAQTVFIDSQFENFKFLPKSRPVSAPL